MPSPSNAMSAATSPLEQIIQKLMADHDAVRNMFREYKKLMDLDAPAAQRESLAADICNALTIHANLEESVFYPAAREALPEDSEECIDHAEVEHASIKALVSQIESGNPDDPLYDAKVHVLGEYVAHHVCEEEDEMFSELRNTEAKMDDLLDAMKQHSSDWDTYLPRDASPEQKRDPATGKPKRASAKKSAPSSSSLSHSRARVSRGAARKTVMSAGMKKQAPRAKSSASKSTKA